MRRMRHPVLVAIPLVMALSTACGSTTSPTASTTASVVATPTPTTRPTPTSTPTMAHTPAATAAQLTVVGNLVYVACSSTTCPGGGVYTTCEAGSSGSNVFATCPLTTRVIIQLKADTAGVISAPDPLGGGQDPVWQTRLVTADPSPTGGVVHVVLGFTGGSGTEKLDLVIVLQGTQLLVDDVYCTGHDPATEDAYAAGWLNRSTCTG